MKLSISARLVLLVALLVTATAATISYYLYKNGVNILTEHALQNLSHDLQRDGDRLTSHIDELKRDVLFISSSPPIPGLIRARKNNGYDPIGQSSTKLWRQRLTSLFTTLLATNPDYMQVRLLDAQGMELIKANQDTRGITLTHPRALQNKSASNYVKASKQLQTGELHISPINLNREFGMINLPYTPVLRCVTPIFDEGKLFGLIIINLNFSLLLKELENTYSTAEQTLYVTNNQGAYLSHPEADKRFAIELDHNYRIQEDFPPLASLFAPGNQQPGRYITPDDPTSDILVLVKIPFDKTQPEQFVAIGLTRNYAQIIDKQTRVLQKNIPIVSSLVLLSIFLAAMFGNILVRPLKQITGNLDKLTMGEKLSLPTTRTDEIGTLARALDEMANKVFTSHQKLRALNNHLEDEIEARTEEVNQNLHLVSTINKAQTSFISELNPHAALQFLLDNLVKLTDSKSGFIAEVLHRNDGAAYIKIYGFVGIFTNDDFYQTYRQDIERGLELDKLQNLFGAVLTQGEAVFCNDLKNDPRSTGIPAGHPPINSFAGLPIYMGEDLIGLVALANRPGGYTDKILDISQPYLTTFTNLLASMKTRHLAQQQDQELQKTRADLQRAIQSSTAVFYTAKAEADYAATFVSENVISQLGYEPTDFTNDPDFWAEHIHPEDRQRVLDDLAQLFKHGKHSNSYRFRDKDGHYLWIQDEVHLQYDEQGRPQEIVGFCTDITERKKIDKMKNEFVSTVSHELRTPLTSIRGSLGLITGGAVGELPEKMQEMLQIASNNTDRLLLLINDILDMQKIESGQMAFTFNPLNVMQLVEQAIHDNLTYAEQYAVKLVISQRQDDARVLGDHGRLMQVLGNLISNAAKFSPEGETVELAVAQHDDAIRISVTDHGQGIPEEFQPKLFEQFTQSDASDTRQKGGTGLGLSIVKAIIKKHGGHIHFISRQGIGTTMFIELPLIRTTEHATLTNTPNRLSDKHHASILIVEDDPDIASLLQQLLARAGYNCDIAYTAAQARELLATHGKEYKAMTLDILLPDTNGISFINELRNQPATRSLPIIVVSVEADATRHRLNGGAIGIIDWLNKPIDEQKLILALDSVCQTTDSPLILHVEDEADIHQIVKMLITDKANLRWAKNLQEARKILATQHFDLILLDIVLPDGSGLSLLADIQQRHPTTKLVIFSAYDVAPEYLQQVHSVLAKPHTDNATLLATIESLLSMR